MLFFVLKILFSFYPCDILKIICKVFLFEILFYFLPLLFYKKFFTFFPCSLFF